MNGARRIAGRLDDLAGELWAEIDGLAGLVEEALAAGPARRADLAIEEHSRALIAGGGGRVAGAGFVAAPGVLADAPYWLEWWQVDTRDGSEGCRRLAAETDPNAIGFRDYTELPWYAGPLASGARHVTGPYVDYVCTDQHTLTFTRPVARDGEFAGVVGADVLVAWVDRELAGELVACAAPCVVINAAGRVVVASGSDWVVGDLVRGLPLGAWFGGSGGGVTGAPQPWVFHPCQQLPLGVIEGNAGR